MFKSAIGWFIDTIITRFHRHEFYESIAKILRNNPEVVIQAKYQEGTVRYYFGTGRKLKTGFLESREFDIRSFDSKGREYLVKDNRAEILLFKYTFSTCVYTKVLTYNTLEHAEAIINYCKSIAQRLRPHTQYLVAPGVLIGHDFLQPEGYKFIYDHKSVLIPFSKATVDYPFLFWASGDNWQKPFDRLKVSVADEDKVLREHRPQHDIRRWLHVDEMESVGDDWVVHLLPKISGSGKARYYSVRLNFNSSHLNKVPFYLEDIMEAVYAQIPDSGKDKYYRDYNEGNIVVEQLTKRERYEQYDKRRQAYPTMIDHEPIVRHRERTK